MGGRRAHGWPVTPSAGSEVIWLLGSRASHSGLVPGPHSSVLREPVSAWSPWLVGFPAPCQGLPGDSAKTELKPKHPGPTHWRSAGLGTTARHPGKRTRPVWSPLRSPHAFPSHQPGTPGPHHGHHQWPRPAVPCQALRIPRHPPPGDEDLHRPPPATPRHSWSSAGPWTLGPPWSQLPGAGVDRPAESPQGPPGPSSLPLPHAGPAGPRAACASRSPALSDRWREQGLQV